MSPFEVSQSNLAVFSDTAEEHSVGCFVDDQSHPVETTIRFSKWHEVLDQSASLVSSRMVK